MGGGFFDNIWGPNSGAYAYPRTQPRPRYYRPQAPVYDAVPEDRSSFKAEEQLKKKLVKTIPVTDGGAPTLQVPVKPVVVARFESEDAAVTKIQAVFRGYVVRKSQPLKHLRVIKKVKEEFETFKGKLQETEQRKKLSSERKERLRWTEGVMGLLLRLDSLQGVHPDVRQIRKELTKEIIRFQETIDSMSTELNGQENVTVTEDADAAKDRAEVIDSTAPNGMEAEDCTVEDLGGVDHDVASGGAIEVREGDSDIRAVEDSTCEKHVPQVHTDMNDQVMNSVAARCSDDQSGTSAGLSDEIMIGGGSVEEPSSTEAHDEVPMDVETKEEILAMAPAHLVEAAEMEIAIAPSTDIEKRNQEASRLEDFVEIIPSGDINSEPISEEDASVALADSVVIAPSIDAVAEANSEEDASRTPAMNDVEMYEQAIVTRRGEEAENMAEEEAGRSASDLCHNLDAFTRQETASERTDHGEGCIVPVSSETQSLYLEPQSFQVGLTQPSSTDGNINDLSDRELLLQVLEENRKLKDVVGKVVHWGRHQNDVIFRLASRIEQLEEHQPPSKLLRGEENNGRKKTANGRKSEKGRRSGKNNPHLRYTNSEHWLSADSDDY